ncbi:hypothetical protein RYX36_033057 [Vicia faba]
MEDMRPNTLLLDDSPYKAILNPVRYIVSIPEVLKRFVTIEKEIVQIEGSVQSSETEGKRAFIAGVADDNGYRWAIAKSLS